MVRSICMKKYSYRKPERIVQKSRFQTIYKQGVWRSSKHFTVVTCGNHEGRTRLGMTVTKKTGSAVTRNRIKRLIREFFRLNKNVFPEGCDVIIMTKRGVPPMTFKKVCAELTELLTRKNFT